MDTQDKGGKGEVDGRAVWKAQSDALALQAWSGAPAAGQGLALRMGAAISLAELLFDALPAGAEDVNRRCMKSASPGKVPSRAMFTAEAQAMKWQADSAYLADEVGASNAEPLGKYGKGLMALLEGCSGKERAQILEVASDYVWRGYCVRFHIPEEQRSEFPKGDPLLNWSHVNALYSKAKFAPGDQMVSFKRTLAIAINNAAREGPSPPEDRASLIDGLSCVYLYASQKFDESAITWAGASEAGIRYNREGKTSFSDLQVNPLAALFAHELQAVYGIKSPSPDAPAALERGRIDAWRAKTEGSKEPVAGPSAPKGTA